MKRRQFLRAAGLAAAGDASLKAAFELYAETSKTNADFKKVYDHWKAFMNQSNQWFRVAEYRLDAFRYGASAW